MLKHLSREAESAPLGSQSPPAKRPCPDLQVNTSRTRTGRSSAASSRCLIFHGLIGTGLVRTRSCVVQLSRTLPDCSSNILLFSWKHCVKLTPRTSSLKKDPSKPSVCHRQNHVRPCFLFVSCPSSSSSSSSPPSHPTGETGRKSKENTSCSAGISHPPLKLCFL